MAFFKMPSKIDQLIEMASRILKAINQIAIDTAQTRRMIVALDQSTIDTFAKLDGAIAVVVTAQTELPTKIAAVFSTKDALIATLRQQLKDAQNSDPATSDQIAKDAKVIADLQQQATDRTNELNNHLSTSATALQTAADAFSKIDLTDHSNDPTSGGTLSQSTMGQTSVVMGTGSDTSSTTTDTIPTSVSDPTTGS